MHKKILFGITLLFHSLLFATDTIQWQKLTPALFEESRVSGKPILLNLEANWCHWCHVMHEKTYHNKEVVDYINTHYLPASADQDANPELAQRYREYGWPATIFLNADGQDIVKRAGYIEAKSFLKLMKAIIKDPSPETMYLDIENISEGMSGLETAYLSSLDYEQGGFDQPQKFVEYESFQLALSRKKDPTLQKWLEKSILGAKKLSDPAWGGIYQYSTHYDWEHLHFEKLLSIQARYTKMFLSHYGLTNDLTSLETAKSTVEYCDRFLLQPSGLYGNAQDADLLKGEHAEAYFQLNDSARMARGLPAIDTNTYTSNNAQLAIALTKLYNVTGDKTYLHRVETIATLLRKRKVNNLYTHGPEKSAIFSLEDQLSVLEFWINQVKLNGNNSDIQFELDQLITTVSGQFLNSENIAVSYIGNNGLTPQPLISENIRLARIFNWYSHYKKDSMYRAKANILFDYLVSPEVQANYYNEPGIILLEQELKTEPFHYMLLQSAKNYDQLNQNANAYANFYSLIDQYNTNNLSEDIAPYFGGNNADALFVCTSSFCSSPLFTVDDLKQFFRQ